MYTLLEKKTLFKNSNARTNAIKMEVPMKTIVQFSQVKLVMCRVTQALVNLALIWVVLSQGMTRSD